VNSARSASSGGGLASIASALARGGWRWGVRLAVLIIAIVLAIAAGFTLYAIEVLPDLGPWHREKLSEEFSARKDSDLDFAGYLALEGRLFAEAKALIAEFPADSNGWTVSRYAPDGEMQRRPLFRAAMLEAMRATHAASA